MRCTNKPYGHKCVLEEGHSNPLSPCFIIVKGSGYAAYQDGAEFIPKKQWPKISEERKMELFLTGEL